MKEIAISTVMSIITGIVANFIYCRISNKRFWHFLSFIPGMNKNDIIYPFSGIREMDSSKNHSCKINSDCVRWECGTIMCWVYVDPIGEGIRDSQNNRYIFAHTTTPGKSPYYNRFSLGCLGKDEKSWEVILTDNKTVPCKLSIRDKLKTGWHHFTFSWNRTKSEMLFFIDKGLEGNDLKPITNWPEKFADNLVIGAWATEHDCHYCNTRIAYPVIIKKYLDCNSPEVIKHFNKKPA